MQKTTAGELDRLLDDLVDRLAGAERAIVLSADGVLTARSFLLSIEDAEQLAAMASAMQSLAVGTGIHFRGGRVRQTVVEMDNAMLAITVAGHGSCLALLTDPESDLGLVAYEMNRMAVQIGATMDVPRRREPVFAGEGRT